MTFTSNGKFYANSDYRRYRQLILDYVTVNVTDLGQGPFIPGFKDPGAGPKPFDPFPGPVIPETPSTTSPPSSSTTEAPGDYVTVNVTDLGHGPFIPGFKDHGFKPLNPGPVIPQTPNTTSPPSSSTTEAPGDSIVVAVADLGLGPLILGFKDGVPVPREPLPSAGAPSV
ncbi:hypothetical protein DdX_19675 [Ditylenchus destructor]|uniref:Uncharacterized protein n=1 Tax=Ditylenchus destructor TaxID=166010 RepID=A0AAD4MM59_9BILA|nr:hypothetical protein DdX_19675 [Ditylenchus destructor]